MNHDLVPSQRDMMRSLYKAYGGQKAAVVAAYARAERDGVVIRKNNTLKWDADKYAGELWRDGVRKGWLT